MASTFRVGDNLGLEYGETLGETGWDDEYNDAMRKLDNVCQLSVKSAESAQPGAPTEGDRYIATTNWGGACTTNDIACYGKATSAAGAGWFYYTPKEGWVCYQRDTYRFRVYYALLGWLDVPMPVINSNTDVDTGTETVDSFADTLCAACRWDYKVLKGAVLRTGSVYACWDAATDAIGFDEIIGAGVGDSSGLTFTVTIAANVTTLSAVAASDDWSVTVVRRVI